MAEWILHVSLLLFAHLQQSPVWNIYVVVSPPQRPASYYASQPPDHTGTCKHSFFKHLVWIWIRLDQPLSCSYLHGLKMMKMWFCQFYYILSFLVLLVLSLTTLRELGRRFFSKRDSGNSRGVPHFQVHSSPMECF